MEITRSENMLVAAIRAERFETDSVLRDAVACVGGTRRDCGGVRALTPDASLLRSSASAWGVQAFGVGTNRCEAAGDVFEFAARDPGHLACSRPDPPASAENVVVFTEVAALVSAAGVMPGTGWGVGVGGMLDVFA